MSQSKTDKRSNEPGFVEVEPEIGAGTETAGNSEDASERAEEQADLTVSVIGEIEAVV